MVALWSFGGPSCALQAACARDSSGVRACLRCRARRDVSLRMSALHGTRATHGSNRSSNNPDTPGGRRIIASAHENLTLLFWQHVERKKQPGHQEEAQEEDSPKTFQTCPYCPPLFLHPMKLCAN